MPRLSGLIGCPVDWIDWIEFDEVIDRHLLALRRGAPVHTLPSEMALHLSLLLGRRVVVLRLDLFGRGEEDF